MRGVRRRDQEGEMGGGIFIWEGMRRGWGCWGGVGRLMGRRIEVSEGLYCTFTL